MIREIPMEGLARKEKRKLGLPNFFLKKSRTSGRVPVVAVVAGLLGVLIPALPRQIDLSLLWPARRIPPAELRRGVWPGWWCSPQAHIHTHSHTFSLTHTLKRSV